MPWTIRIALLAAAGLLCISVVGLWSTRAADAGARPDRIRIGVLPDRSAEVLKTIYEPLVRYMSRRVSIPCDLVIAKDYEGLVARFNRGDVHLAWFGALTYVQVRRSHGAVPVAMRDVDAHFTTVFLVRKEDAAASLEELKGRRLAFGNRHSTSGHLMARHYLVEAGLDPDRDFRDVHCHPTHDETAEHVRDGRADIAAVNGLLVESMYATGELSRDEVVVLARTKPYTNYVWAAQPSLDRGTRNALRAALLRLDFQRTADAAILKAQQCRGYLPARPDEFDRIEKIAVDLELLKGD